MPSFVYRLRDSYERTRTEEDGTADKKRQSPPPIHLTQPIDGLQQPAAFAMPSSRAPSSTRSLLLSCCYVLCFIPSLLFSAVRAGCNFVRRSCCRTSNKPSLVLLTSTMSALITLFMVIALAQDRFAHVHYNAPSPPAAATIGSFHYCLSAPTTDSPTCHTIDRHCTAGGYDLAALVGHRGESVTCERFDAFRAFFLLAFIASLSSPITLALYIVPPHWRHYALVVAVAVVEAACVLLSMIFFLPLLPRSSAAVPATSHLSSSFWLQFSAFLFAIVVAAVTSYEERKRRRDGWRANSGPRSDRAEAESIMAAAARRQGKPITEMAVATAGTMAAEQLEEGVVVSGVFALGSDVEHDLDLDHYRDSTSSGGRQYTRDAETVDDVEREYAQTAQEHEANSESGKTGSARSGGKNKSQEQEQMHTVGLAGARPDRASGEADERRRTVGGRLP